MKGNRLISVFDFNLLKGYTGGAGLYGRRLIREEIERSLTAAAGLQRVPDKISIRSSALE